MGIGALMIGLGLTEQVLIAGKLQSYFSRSWLD